MMLISIHKICTLQFLQNALCTPYVTLYSVSFMQSLK